MPRGDDAVGLPDLLFPFRGLASIPLSERSASLLVLLRCNCILVTKKPRQRAPGTRRGCDGSPCSATIRNTKAGRARLRAQRGRRSAKKGQRPHTGLLRRRLGCVFPSNCSGPQTPLIRLRLEPLWAPRCAIPAKRRPRKQVRCTRGT